MADLDFIDLTSSPEPEHSPNKAAVKVLAQFQPSKERKRQRILQPPEHFVIGTESLDECGKVVESHRAQNHVEERNNTLSQDRPWSKHGRAVQKEWRSPKQALVLESVQSTPAQRSSLAWILEQEARTIPRQSQIQRDSSPNHPQAPPKNGLDSLDLQKEPEKVTRAYGSGEEPCNGVRDLRPSSTVKPAWGQHSTRAAENVTPKPLLTPPSNQTQEDNRIRPFKRPAPALEISDAKSIKRVARPADKARPFGSAKAQNSLPTAFRNSQFVDVTNSIPEERETLSDETHDWNQSNHVAKQRDFRNTASPQPPSDTKFLPSSTDQAGKARPRISNHGVQYSAEEDALLKELKEIHRLSWDEIVPHFKGRTRGSLQVRYSTKILNRPSAMSSRTIRHLSTPTDVIQGANSESPDPTSRPKRHRKPVIAAADGFVSWAAVSMVKKSQPAAPKEDVKPAIASKADPLSKQDRAFPSSLSRILRHRELGKSGGRAWASQTKCVSEELAEHVFSNYALTKYHHGTSGDVLSVSWSPDGSRFAAGSAAISDQASMQYNMSRNLLLGDVERSELRELIEHHEPRPLMADPSNVNALHAMRESQDSRLFVTVTATGFSRDGKQLFTAGKDRRLRVYSTGERLHDVHCRYASEHAAAVDLLSVHNDGLVATGSHLPSDCVNVYHCREPDYHLALSLSPIQGDIGSPLPLYPSALRWGVASQHQNFLLAGFCTDGSVEDEHSAAGATCIWNIHTGQQLPIKAATYGVSDVAWNPLPSSGSNTFAVASNPSGISVNKGIRSVIQCFAPDQDILRRTLTWQCPALDINDVVFCPHDCNLIACGATDGKVYIWDQRSASRSQEPLHILSHGDSLTVLPGDRAREVIDTGVRFLSWGSTKTRLYSGSSDGIVKVWNPYRSSDNVEVDEFTTPRHQRSAIMAGAFSPDARDLLVGTEVGQLNLFSIGRRGYARPATRLKLRTAPAPRVEHTDPAADTRALLAAGKIELRPCGALPIRQAVQGPNYDGPFAASTQAVEQAQDMFQQALNTQNELHLQGTSVNEVELEKASTKVKDAAAALVDQEDRLQFLRSCEPKAQAFQRSLRAAEESRAAMLAADARSSSVPVEPCSLPCGYFEPNAERAADSGDAQLRVPGFLRLARRVADTDRTGDADADVDAPTDCPTCFPFRTARKSRVRCDQCVLKQAGLTGHCSRCAGPARPSTEPSVPTLCATCGFACFRCGRPTVLISPGGSLVRCVACDLTWEAGVLGYDLVGSMNMKTSVVRSRDKRSANEDCGEVETEEIEHYASRWEVTLPYREDGAAVHFALR